jgi:hypothetical protein
MTILIYKSETRNYCPLGKLFKTLIAQVTTTVVPFDKSESEDLLDLMTLKASQSGLKLLVFLGLCWLFKVVMN